MEAFDLKGTPLRIQFRTTHNGFTRRGMSISRSRTCFHAWISFAYCHAANCLQYSYKLTTIKRFTMSNKGQLLRDPFRTPLRREAFPCRFIWSTASSCRARSSPRPVRCAAEEHRDPDGLARHFHGRARPPGRHPAGKGANCGRGHSNAAGVLRAGRVVFDARLGEACGPRSGRFRAGAIDSACPRRSCCPRERLERRSGRPAVRRPIPLFAGSGRCGDRRARSPTAPTSSSSTTPCRPGSGATSSAS